MMELIYAQIPELLVKTTVLLIIAYGLCKICRNKSAAFRGQIWLSAMLFSLLLPLFMLWLPSLNLIPASFVSDQLPISRISVDIIDAEHSSVQSASDEGSDSHVQAASSQQLLQFGLIFWAAGSVVMLVLAYGQRQIGRKLLKRAVLVDDIERQIGNTAMLPKTPIYYSDDLVTPVAIGLRQTVILLPTTSRNWEKQKLLSAILHEQAHVENGDNLARAIALLTRCFLWFHPLVWLGFNRLKEEQEKAADDKVINSGVTASRYAKDLLDIVKSINGQDGQKGLVASMGSYSFFPQRMKAILAEKHDRTPTSGRNKLTMMGISMLVSLPIAAITTTSNVSRYQSVPETLFQMAESDAALAPIEPLDPNDAFYANGATLSGEEGSQLLLSAARRNDKSMLELLFESGVVATPEAQNEMLTSAANRANIDLLQLYFEAGMSLENTDQAKLLSIAVNRADLKMTALLILAGIDVSQNDMQSLLKLVEQRGDKKMLVLLLEAEQIR